MRRPQSEASWWRPVLTIVVPVLAITAAAVAVLIAVLAPRTAPERLDTIRTALAVGAGIGALITLALALRRQQATEHDAAERRLTELYVKAVDQLGSDKAAVRHGGLYALERVAQDNPAHRQTVVDVICAYLRSPFADLSTPGAGAGKVGVMRALLRRGWARRLPDNAEDATQKDSNQEVRQEREVRLTAQQILLDHLKRYTPVRSWRRWFPRPPHTFWPDIKLVLTGATLIDFDLSDRTVRIAMLDGARFIGSSDFSRTRFEKYVGFDEARFDGNVSFIGTGFDGYTNFTGTQFNGDVKLDGARFYAFVPEELKRYLPQDHYSLKRTSA